jgi:hypothetical protein
MVTIRSEKVRHHSIKMYGKMEEELQVSLASEYHRVSANKGSSSDVHGIKELVHVKYLTWNRTPTIQAVAC